MATYDKNLPQNVKCELTENALEEIHPGAANEIFCELRKDNVDESVFNAEFYDMFNEYNSNLY